MSERTKTCTGCRGEGFLQGKEKDRLVKRYTAGDSIQVVTTVIYEKLECGRCGGTGFDPEYDVEHWEHA